jgi:hexosaminidase
MKPAAHMVLLPTPRQIEPEQGTHTLKHHREPAICDASQRAAAAAQLIHSDLRHLLRLDLRIRRSNFDKAAASPLLLQLDPARPPQGYVLHITPKQIKLTFSEAAGAWYGALTLRQLVRHYGEALPACRIEDAPDFPSRGVMLDISRDKVPTQETLYRLVDELAELKYNRFELYIEHTFAYQRHPEVWADASPMTAEQMRELDAFCAARFIELVPNQNSFGHLHRWLKHPRYAPLAEAPDGFVTPWGERREGPFSLNPLDPGSLELVRELFAELLPNFTSRNVNVGCDETFDLGQGRSRDACERAGKGRVYLDYLLNIHRLIHEHGRTLQFWGDIILHHPELIPELPRDVVPLVWGYEADHPFDEQCARFAATGLAFHVCPGTSSWNSLVGRTDTGIANLRLAAEAGRRHGASGYLVTDWGDNGHWQPYAASLLPFAAGAGFAWCGQAQAASDLMAQADRHVFRDPRGGTAERVHELGQLHRVLEHPIANASALFRLLSQKSIANLREAIPAERMQRAHVRLDELLMALLDAPCDRDDAALLREEWAVACGLARFALQRGLDVPSDQRGPELTQTLQRYRQQWLARNRPGGLADSLSVLERRAATS